MHRPHRSRMPAAVMAALLGATLGALGRATGLASAPRADAILPSHDFLPKRWRPPPPRKFCGSRNSRTRKRKHRCVKPVRRWKAHAK